MPPRWPVFPKAQLDVPGNDDRHNRIDANKGGSPLGRTPGGVPSKAPGQTGNPGSQSGVSRTGGTPVASRGGFGTNGRDKVFVRAGMSGARSGSGNPASRGGFRGQARGGNFQPDARVPGHGGSPQHRGGAGTGAQFGRPGQTGVPGGNPTHGPAGAGNTSGLAYRRIAGRFKRAAMGARPTSSNSGKYGSPPVSANT